MERFIVSIEKQDDGTYIAYNTNVDATTLIGTGRTVAEAKEDFFNSMKEDIEICNENGIEVNEALLSEPEFHFDVASLFEYYSFINVSAFARWIGMNESLLRQYKKGNVYVSEAQLKKIEDGFHRLSKEFCCLNIA